ncbi:MAG: phosphate ABC transporter substrate-binding protein PstS [Actinobacteria bacterium]|nr:phosphate ABC transporter substrate-binding protein PstS [Actinomycetota bacterium]
MLENQRKATTPGGLLTRGWTRIVAASLSLGLLVAASACSGGASPVTAPTSAPASAPTSGASGTAPAGAITPAKNLTGAGSTLAYPLYSKWFNVYNQQYGVQVNYQAIGSGAGIQQLIQKTVDFGASDAPMTDEQLKSAPSEILHIPTVLGAVAITYNVPGVTTSLKFTPDVIAGIFLGNITKWSDPKIAADNPGVKFPDTAIAVVHRSDGSGTTNIFTDYLSNVSPEWKSKVGTGISVNWPVGIGAKGSEGVAGQVRQITGAIGYVELAYAIQNKMPYGLVKNQAGQFVEPTLDSTVAAAAADASNMPADMRVSIVNAPGATSYPIAGYTYILVYKEQSDASKGKALVNLLWWGIHDGESYAKGLLYGSLPANVVTKDEAAIKSITYQGKPLYQ